VFFQLKSLTLCWDLQDQLLGSCDIGFKRVDCSTEFLGNLAERRQVGQISADSVLSQTPQDDAWSERRKLLRQAKERLGKCPSLQLSATATEQVH
jgi:hypothetical protein